MTESAPEALEGAPPASSPSRASGTTSASAGRLADGEWHRLHPATPLLKGGIALVAILGVIIVNLRDVLINCIRDQDFSFDTVDNLTRRLF